MCAYVDAYLCIPDHHSPPLLNISALFSLHRFHLFRAPGEVRRCRRERDRLGEKTSWQDTIFKGPVPFYHRWVSNSADPTYTDHATAHSNPISFQFTLLLSPPVFIAGPLFPFFSLAVWQLHLARQGKYVRKNPGRKNFLEKVGFYCRVYHRGRNRTRDGSW